MLSQLVYTFNMLQEFDTIGMAMVIANTSHPVVPLDDGLHGAQNKYTTPESPQFASVDIVHGHTLSSLKPRSHKYGPNAPVPEPVSHLLFHSCLERW